VTGAPQLDVAIVSYRCRTLLHACLESLRRFPPEGGAHVVVVDNDSRDGTVELVRGEFPDVELVDTGANLGFAAATNMALLRGTAPYALVLNPDTEVLPDGLTALVALLEERPEIGMLGCRLVRPDGRFDHAAKRSFPTPLSALAHFTGLGRMGRAPSSLSAYRATELDENEAGPVDAVNGAFMLIRRSALEQVGLFDEGYWMYMEDLDLCYRFAQARWTTWYEPSVTVVHVKGGTSGRWRAPRLVVAFHYGMFRFYRKHYAADHNVALNLVVYAGIAAKLAVALVRSSTARAAARFRGRRRSRASA
jgi:GT2 family glycosyltransferase